MADTHDTVYRARFVDDVTSHVQRVKQELSTTGTVGVHAFEGVAKSVNGLSDSLSMEITKLTAERSLLADPAYQKRMKDAEALRREIDNLTKSVTKEEVAQQSSLSRLGSGLQHAASELPGVNAGVGQFTMLLNAAKNPLVAIPALLAGGAVAAGEMASSQAELVVHLTHLSAASGLTVNELFGLRKLVKPLGMDIDQVSHAVGRFETNLGKNSKALHKLGIDSKDPTEALAQVADKFMHAEAQSQKAAIGAAAFGRAWQDMAAMLEQGSGPIKQALDTKKYTQEQVEQYEAIHKKEIEISREWTMIKTSIADAAAGPLLGFLGGLQSAVGYLKETNHLWELLQTAGPGATDQTATLKKQGAALGQMMVDGGAIDNQGRLYVDKLTDAFKKADKKTMQAALMSVAAGDLDRFGQETVMGLVKSMQKTLRETPDPVKAKKDGSPTELTDEEKRKAQEERAFMMELRDQNLANVKSSHDRELALIDAKYNALREKHKGFSASIREIDKAEAIEKENLQKKTFNAQVEKESKAAKEHEALLTKRAEYARTTDKMSVDSTVRTEETKLQAIENTTVMTTTQITVQNKAILAQVNVVKAALDREAALQRQSAQSQKQLDIEQGATEVEAERRYSANVVKIDTDLEKKKTGLDTMYAQKNKRITDIRKQEYEQTSHAITSFAASETASLLDYKTSWADKVSNLEHAVYMEAVNMGIQMLSKKAEAYVMDQILGEANAAATTATQVATATAIGAAWAGPAMAASIATLGEAAVTGMSGFEGAMAVSKVPLAANGGFGFGGMVVGEGKRGEAVMPVTPSRIYSHQSTVHNNIAGSTIIINGAGDPHSTAQAVAAVLPRASQLSNSNRRQQSRG